MLAACQAESVTFDGTDTRPKRTAALTPDGSDRYVFGGSGGTAVVRAPATNKGENLRMAFWPTGARAVVDGQSCASWTGERGPRVQEGAALRLKLEPSGRLRAVTITKNVLWGAVWNFNVHTWDTTRSPAFQKVGDVSLEQELRPNGTVRPPPWHVCARVVGATAQLKVWTGSEPEPTWEDTKHGGKVALPAGWTYPGTDGWYVGHLPAAGDASYADLRTSTYDAPSK
ncbi:MAG: hypothetical protein JWN46_309 [Acidimicrobiales bacterium]|nr:hypothetical protein [Acidimicrobiales bacterium]